MVFRIIGAVWTPEVIKAKLWCDKCGTTHSHRNDRHKVVCPKCGSTEQIYAIRERDLEESRIAAALYGGE